MVDRSHLISDRYLQIVLNRGQLQKQQVLLRSLNNPQKQAEKFQSYQIVQRAIAQTIGGKEVVFKDNAWDCTDYEQMRRDGQLTIYTFNQLDCDCIESQR